MKSTGAELLAGSLHLRLHLDKHALEHIGIGALEGIDRLLAVAHHEQRAGLAAVPALAGKELFRQ